MTKVLDNEQKAKYDFAPTQHTFGHVQCPACEASRAALMQSEDFAELRFRPAFDVWIESRTKLSPACVHDYKKNAKRLEPFFGTLRLSEVHAGHIKEYVTHRKLKAGASRINQEISVLQQMLKRAGIWANIGPWYEPMPLPRTGPGIALEPEEEAHLFEIAALKPKWKVAFLASMLTNNTTAGPTEIRKLQLKDVNLEERMIFVRDGAKNQYRIRSIPLNDDALWAVSELLARCTKKGAYLPGHYLLPSRTHGVASPMESWKKAWYALRAEAGKRFPRLLTLRRYDLRHNSLTKLLESPDVSEQVAKDIAGHVSNKMLQRYSHVRAKAKRDAVATLTRKHPQPAHFHITAVSR